MRVRRPHLDAKSLVSPLNSTRCPVIIYTFLLRYLGCVSVAIFLPLCNKNTPRLNMMSKWSYALPTFCVPSLRLTVTSWNRTLYSLLWLTGCTCIPGALENSLCYIPNKILYASLSWKRQQKQTFPDCWGNTFLGKPNTLTPVTQTIWHQFGPGTS